MAPEIKAKNPVISAVIIDDEPIARKIIRDYLKEEESIDVIGECGNGADAVVMILEKKPDLVFLDIQMPEMDGFEVIDTLGVNNLPFIIFVTAYDQYAVKAFEINALDYLLKPFDDDRFFGSIRRAVEYIHAKKNYRSELFNLLRDHKKKQKYLNRILIKTGGRYVLLKTGDIQYIEAAADYARIFTGKKESSLIRDTMNNIENRLNPDVFIRIHRSYIVNIEFIKEFQPWDKNNYIIVLKNGTELKLSRKHKDRLFEIFDQPSI